MDDISLASIKRKKIINRIVFIVLCVLIAFLLTFNIILVTNAYFTNTGYSNSSVITTGNVAINYVVMNGEGDIISTPIQLQDSALIPGDPIDYDIAVSNAGNNSCYIRMKLKFYVKVNGEFEEIPIVVMNSRDGAQHIFERTETVGNKQIKYLYYDSSVPTSGSNTATFPITFVISESEGVELINYTGSQYKITVVIEAIQSTGVTLSSDTINTSSGWTDSETHDRITIFD
ncbi:MAG TPA: hypothetical protein DCO89_02785 [Clostridiales bacterium]|nr:hypothetical protein [Clostridiales bacterium]